MEQLESSSFPVLLAVYMFQSSFSSRRNENNKSQEIIARQERKTLFFLATAMTQLGWKRSNESSLWSPEATRPPPQCTTEFIARSY